MRQFAKGGGPSSVARTCALEHALRRERHDASVAVVGLHELLDPEGHPIDEAQLLRNVFLVAKRQAVLLAAGAQVKKVPDTPEHLASVFELMDLARQ